MSLKKRIQEDFKDNLRSKKELEVSVLRMVLSVLQNKEIEEKGKKRKAGEEIEEEVLNDEEVQQVVLSEIKKGKESIEQFIKGERMDLAEKEKKEIEILKKYAPEQLSEEEVEKIVKEAIQEVGAESIKDMGNVMKNVLGKTKGKADGAVINNIVKKILN